MKSGRQPVAPFEGDMSSKASSCSSTGMEIDSGRIGFGDPELTVCEGATTGLDKLDLSGKSEILFLIASFHRSFLLLPPAGGGLSDFVS